MAYKFVLALLFVLILSPALITAEPLRVRLKFHGNKKVSDASAGSPAESPATSPNLLIQTACRGIGGYESDCVEALNNATDQEKQLPSSLCIYTLKFVETNVANLSTLISAKATESGLPPLLQSALSDCSEQYIPLDDLVEDAITSLVEKAYPDVKQFIQAAILNTDQCDAGLKRDKLQEKAEQKDAGNFIAAKDMMENNMYIRTMLSAAMNLVPKE